MINNVTLIGRLGKDPEVRYLDNDQTVANFSLATTEKYKKDGEKQEKTEWHSCVAWNKLAEIVEQYAKKGSLVYIEGKLQTRNWKDDSGTKRYTTEIIVTKYRSLQFKNGGEPDSTESEKTSEEEHVDDLEM